MLSVDCFLFVKGQLEAGKVGKGIHLAAAERSSVVIQLELRGS